VFAEFFCANSFAGMHQKDDRKQLVLFDVETEGGMVIPDRFIQDFGKLYHFSKIVQHSSTPPSPPLQRGGTRILLHSFLKLVLNIARVIYRGKLTGKFMDDLRKGKYGVDEGVVCKGGRNANNLWMVKIKTDAYMQRLQQAFKDDWENYWE